MGGPTRVEGWHQEINRVGLRLRMRQILTDPICEKIDFTLGTAGVSRYTFKNVAEGLMQVTTGPAEFDKVEKVHKQKVMVRFNIRAGMGELTFDEGKLYASKGEYDSSANTFMFPWEDPGADLGREGTIIHESVHAGFDFEAKPISRLDDEAAARVAAEMYKLLKNPKYSADPKSIDMVFQRAAEVVIDSRKCYIFPENHRRIMHEVLFAGGYRFSASDTAHADGAAATPWWLTVKQVGKP